VPAKKTEPIKRFFKHVNIAESGCWEWTGSGTKAGYGRFGNGERVVGAHCFSYEYFKGPIPEGYEIDHLCHNPKCVNPDHLEAVTREENLKRQYFYGRGDQQREKTYCPKGHPYDEENTYYYRNAQGNIARQCKTCMRLRERNRNTIKREG